jgi:hypothetical protein
VRAAGVGYDDCHETVCMLPRTLTTPTYRRTGVTTLADRVFTEVDRQLEFVRTQAEGVATRSGLLIATTAVAASVLAARIQTGKLEVGGALIALGVAGAAGIVVLVPYLRIGADIMSLTTWGSAPSAQRASATTQLYQSKLITLGANSRRLLFVTWTFYLQCLAVAVAVVLAFISTVGK